VIEHANDVEEFYHFEILRFDSLVVVEGDFVVEMQD
jgi:hypothetical protein